MIFYFCLFRAAVRRIHQNNVKLIVLGVVQYIVEQGVRVENLRNIKIVQKHICNAEHIRKLLFLDTVDRIIVFFFILGGCDLLVQFFQPACDKSAGAAGKIRHFFADFRLNHL